jgi:hypothetical protein
MLSIICVEYHLCWVSFMMSIIYSEYHLCWISFMLSINYAEYHLFWVSFTPCIIYAEYHLCWVSLMLCGALLIVTMLNVILITVVKLNAVYAKCHNDVIFLNAIMLNIIYVKRLIDEFYCANCLLCQMSFILSVLYAKCTLCWASNWTDVIMLSVDMLTVFILNVVYADCH